MTNGKTDKWRKGTNYGNYWESEYWQSTCKHKWSDDGEVCFRCGKKRTQKKPQSDKY